jgi:DNA (cytosine-5)-methyltransferase 1
MLDFEMQDRTKPDINISGALRSGSQSYLYDNHAQDSRVKQTDVAPTLNLNEGMLPLVQECSSARTYRSNMSFDQSHTSQTLLKNDVHLTISQSRVRRLSPRECERLQGFSSSFTKVPYRGKTAEECPDGPRYKALGNSIAVPVLRWIGDRIMMVEEMK